MKTDISHLAPIEQEALKVFITKLKKQCDDQMLSALLFGSRARGDAKTDSDVDIAVIIGENDPKLSKTIRSLAVDIWLEHDLMITTCVWSQAHWQKMQALQTGLYRNIQKEGIDLLKSFAG